MHFVKKHSVIYLLIVLGLDALLFGFTDPAHVASLWLIVAYVLAVATLYWVVQAVVGLASLYVSGIKKQRRRLVKLLTVLSAVLLALQSTGQLSVKDMALLVPLVILGYFYFSYGRKGKAART